MYVYIRSEPRLWTAGFYRPDGKWEPDSDHGSQDEAARRVSTLNGTPDTTALRSALDSFDSNALGKGSYQAARNLAETVRAYLGGTP